MEVGTMAKGNKRYNSEELEERRAYNQLMNRKHTDKLYRKLDHYQNEYYHAIEDHKIVFVDEKAGTGKTTVAVMSALEHLRDGKVDKIVYVRFPSKRGESLGFTPGDLKGPGGKESKYMKPFYEAMAKCGLQGEAVADLIADEVIVVTTDIDMRGTNIENSFVIIDEAQNAVDKEQLKLVLTRIHDRRCPTVVIGDSNQTDSKVAKYTRLKYNSFEIYQIHMTKKNWAVKCELKINYRGAVSQWADEVEQTIKELDEMFEEAV